MVQPNASPSARTSSFGDDRSRRVARRYVIASDPLELTSLVGGSPAGTGSIATNINPATLERVADVRFADAATAWDAVGPDVAEFLQAATTAIVGAALLARLRHAVPAFPTRSEVWLRLLETYESERRTGRLERAPAAR